MAATDVEIELKLQLGSFTDYLKLMGFLGAVDEIRNQVNGFFDSSKRQLQKRGWALRVRADDTRGFVTLKGLASSSSLATVRPEIEVEINRSTALELLRGTADLAELDIAPVRFVTEKVSKLSLSKCLEFRNERQIKRFKISDRDYFLEVDRTEFSDGSTDYELEVEVDDENRIESVEDSLRKLFTSLGIPFHKQDKSKFERALEKADPALHSPGAAD